MTDVRKALLDVWESIYQIQVIGCAMDPSLLDQFDAHIVNLQYRIAIAKQRANPCAPRGPSAEAKALAEQDAAIEKIIRESKAPCLNLPTSERFTDLGKWDKEWAEWHKKYGYLDGCIKADGSIRKFQLGGGFVSSGFYYKQIEVFQ